MKLDKMTDIEDNICRLCLSKMETDYEAIDEAKIKNLSSILLDLHISITENPVACKRCARDLEHACHFKSTCLQTEEIVTAFVALSDQTTLDLKDIYLSENANSDLKGGEDYICRFCLTCVKSDSCLALGILKDNMIIVRDMLTTCLPELDFSLTFEPVVCTACIKSTERYFTFSKVCLEIEQKFVRYYRSLRKTDGGKIKLSELVQSIEKNLMGNSVSEYTRRALGMGIEPPKPITNERKTSEKTIIRKSNLKKHKYQITHSNNELIEHKCQLCPFTAKRKNHLAVHGLSHDPKRNYKCDLCSFETRRKNLLVTHTKTHRRRKEELFKCVLCPYEADIEASFKRHMKSHFKVTSNPNVVAQDLMIIKEGGNLRLVSKDGKM